MTGLTALTAAEKLARADAWDQEAGDLERRTLQGLGSPHAAHWGAMARTMRLLALTQRWDVEPQAVPLAEAHRLLLGQGGRDYTAQGQSDLYGKLGEHSFTAHLQASGCTILEGPRAGYFPGYDLRAEKGGRGFTVEVKTDLALTHNCFVEAGESDGTSGVTKTEADYFVVYRPHLGQFFTAPTANLRAWLGRKNLGRVFNTKSARRTWGYLVPHARWTEIPGAKVINWQPPSESVI